MTNVSFVAGLDEAIRDLQDRVAVVRQGLARAFSMREAMVVLSMADRTTLRVVEKDFTFTPAPFHANDTELRQHIARLHLKHLGWMLNDQSRSTDQVTPEVFQQLAEETLALFLVGDTDFRPEIGGQHRITLLRNGPSASDEPPGAVFEVVTCDGYDPRRFRVQVVVESLE